MNAGAGLGVAEFPVGAVGAAIHAFLHQNAAHAVQYGHTDGFKGRKMRGGRNSRISNRVGCGQVERQRRSKKGRRRHCLRTR
jgi:hypothetical protein